MPTVKSPVTARVATSTDWAMFFPTGWSSSIRWCTTTIFQEIRKNSFPIEMLHGCRLSTLRDQPHSSAQSHVLFGNHVCM